VRNNNCHIWSKSWKHFIIIDHSLSHLSLLTIIGSDIKRTLYVFLQRVLLKICNQLTHKMFNFVRTAFVNSTNVVMQNVTCAWLKILLRLTFFPIARFWPFLVTSVLYHCHHSCTAYDNTSRNLILAFGIISHTTRLAMGRSAINVHLVAWW
jgi:hypothetical protein